jgi:succinate dehydrogenase / fumarate reductase iron-sulfur subunit
VPELLSGLPTVAKAMSRGKMTPKTALMHPHRAPKEVKRIFEVVEGREERVELNLYVSGYEDEPEESTETATDTESENS